MKKTLLLSVFTFSVVSLVGCKENASSLIKDDSVDSDLSYTNPTPAPVKSGDGGITIDPQPTVPADGKYSGISFDKTVHDFGDIKEGEKVQTTFTINSTGEKDLVITNASASCGCTVPEYPKNPIKPGNSAPMVVSFDSSGKPGRQEKQVTVNANDEKRSHIVTIKMNVIPNK